MDRRVFLKSTALLAGVVGTGGVLTACGRGGGQPAGGAARLPEGDPSLAPQIASFELLTGGPRPVPFGLRTLDNVEVSDAAVDVYLRDLDGKVVGGPFPSRYTEEAGGLGLYVTELPLTEPGQMEFVAVAGDRYGTQAVNVVPPAKSQAPVPGAKATVTPTPTTENEMGMAALCTQDPPCGMHSVSLDDALKAGRPVMLLFATPAYCQTAVCGPAVGTVDGVREGGDWGDTAWIHVEIYSDQGETLARPVQAWKLPTEPWLFGIDGGKIAGRLDGPMLPDMIEGLATEISPG